MEYLLKLYLFIKDFVPTQGRSPTSWSKSALLQWPVSWLQPVATLQRERLFKGFTKNICIIYIFIDLCCPTTDHDEREDALTWLRYWVVLAIFSLAETIVDPLLDFFPGYLLGKCVFLVWCMAPSKNSGANLLFTKVCIVLHFYQSNLMY